jgi:hypothetical protein
MAQILLNQTPAIDLAPFSLTRQITQTSNTLVAHGCRYSRTPP